MNDSIRSLAPSRGRSLINVSSNSLCFAVVIFFTFRSFHERVCTRLAATTEGLSIRDSGTSVVPPRMLVLTGQHISNPVLRLYSRLLSTRAGRYADFLALGGLEVQPHHVFALRYKRPSGHLITHLFSQRCGQFICMCGFRVEVCKQLFFGIR
jgi:hypothetical protein